MHKFNFERITSLRQYFDCQLFYEIFSVVCLFVYVFNCRCIHFSLYSSAMCSSVMCSSVIEPYLTVSIRRFEGKFIISPLACAPLYASLPSLLGRVSVKLTTSGNMDTTFPFTDNFLLNFYHGNREGLAFRAPYGMSGRGKFTGKCHFAN